MDVDLDYKIEVSVLLVCKIIFQKSDHFDYSYFAYYTLLADFMSNSKLKGIKIMIESISSISRGSRGSRKSRAL